MVISSNMNMKAIKSLNKLHCRDYYDSKQADQGFITFDLEADLAPLFNWNVKVSLLLHFLKVLL